MFSAQKHKFAVQKHKILRSSRKKYIVCTLIPDSRVYRPIRHHHRMPDQHGEISPGRSGIPSGCQDILHTGLLLVASTRATILTACLVELPCQVENKGATSRIKYRQLSWTIQGGLGFVGTEYVVAAQVEGQ